MWIEEQHTIKLLEDSFDCARAAAAGHGDVELVLVFGHGVCVCVEGERERGSMRVGVEEGVVLMSVVMAWNRGFPLEAVDC